MQLPEVVSLRTEYGVSLQKSMLESLIGCTIVWGLKLSIVEWGADPILALRNLFGPADVMSDTPRIRVVTKFSAHPRPEYQAIYPPSVFVTPKPFGHHADIARCPSCFALHNFRASRQCAKQEGKHTHTQMRHTLRSKNRDTQFPNLSESRTKLLRVSRWCGRSWCSSATAWSWRRRRTRPWPPSRKLQRTTENAAKSRQKSMRFMKICFQLRISDDFTVYLCRNRCSCQ